MTHRRRNRSVSTIPTYDKKEILNNANASSYINCLERVLGENIDDSIKKCTREKHAFGDCTLGDIFDLKLSGISSSSSLTWSDDYDYEVSKRVQSELERIDRCFQGIGVPTYYKEEINEWLHFFPHLSILGYKTPSNSLENSEASSESDDEQSTVAINSNSTQLTSSNKTKRKNEQVIQKILHRKGQTIHPKPKSLDIDKYLRISSIKSPYLDRKKDSVPTPSVKDAHRLSEPSEYISLPFITNALKAETSHHKQPKPVSKLILPPIINNARSVSATPRQSSTKSMFVRLNFEKDIKAKEAQMELKSDLLKLFEHIPVSNR
ncbi:uncharacterized protein LOC143191789 isoform X2 [Rhynchophorus ferrugineus]|uniref:uncharacterized protein LOC143191789 isoform X2 n=1 Tax=Rhynchophorus ferrugineus TaxID=354439 RepID=UPI003FCDA4B7